MNLEAFSTKWFTVYYLVFACLMIGSGIYLIIRNQQFTEYLERAAEQENPPILLIRILKYLLLFTLPGLVLSFMPFSWIELLFSLWSLLLVYIAGVQLVRWKQRRQLINQHIDRLPDIVRSSGAIMVAVGFAIFLLAYLVIKRPPV